jgi:hypothetical protein
MHHKFKIRQLNLINHYLCNNRTGYTKEGMFMIDDTGTGLFLYQLKLLGFTSKDLFQQLENKSDSSKKYQPNNSAYRFIRSYRYKGKGLVVKYYKNIAAWALPDYYFSFHLCQFNSFAEYKLWLEELLGPFFNVLFNESEIFRLDCCLETTEVSLDYVFTNGYRRYVSLPQLKLYGDFYEI